MRDDSDLIQMLRTEFRDGFAMLSAGINQTNVRLDQTNVHLDQTNARLVQNIAAVEQTNARVDQTIARVDQTIARLDDSIIEAREFRREMASKLDGISTLILRYDKDVVRIDDRLSIVEQRVDQLERKDQRNRTQS